MNYSSFSARPAPYDEEAGSVLIWIMMVVLLFAAVTAVVNHGSRTQGSLMTEQQARIQAMEIIAFGNDLRQAVQTLRIGGCMEEQISFTNDTYRGVGSSTALFGANHNGNAPTDQSCDVFADAGAGMSATRFAVATSEDNTGTARAGDALFAVAQVEGIGSADPELVVYLEKINPQICDTISQLLAVTSSGEEAPVDPSGGSMALYHGAFDAVSYPVFGDQSSALAGKNAFCAKSASGGAGVFVSVLIAR